MKLLGIAPEQERRAADEPPTFWLSFADLMTGLVMVFILVLMVVLHWKGTQLEEQQIQLRSQSDELEIARNRLAKVEVQVRAMLGVRAELISLLRKHFSTVQEKVEVDPKTGAIRIGEAVLFDWNSDSLKTSGAQVVARVYQKLATVLFQTDFPYKTHLAAIYIEGHASREKLKRATHERVRKDYLTNLELSQRRAQAVLDYLSGIPQLDQGNLRRYGVAVGYGYARPVNTIKPGSADNRRIEITFRLKDEEALEQMRNLLNKMK